MIVPKPSLKRSLETATTAYHEQLMEDDRALNYLVGERNIMKEALAYFKIGIVREPHSGHEHFRNRISFPYYTRTGVVSIRFRYLGDHTVSSSKKFLASTGDVARIYNVTSLLGNDRVYLCEGETDTITCWMAGLSAIGIPGVEAWKPEFSRVLRHRDVVVLADNDDEGQGKRFADEIFRSLNGSDTILMPRGHDVSSFVLEYGVQALRHKVGL